MARMVKLADIVPSRFAHLTPPNEENIERIRVDLVDGCKVLLNEPHVFREDTKWELLAGHDRVEAARRAGWTEVQVRDFSGAVNTDDQILSHFCRENLLRKEVSKAAIAGEWLKKHPEWSDGRLAEQSGCSRQHVGETRAEMGIVNPQVLASSRTGQDGKVREYKPRQVRGNVPSGKTIPHPTSKVPAYESAADMADALTKRSGTPEATGAPPDGIVVSTSTAFEVGVPAGVDPLPVIPEVGTEAVREVVVGFASLIRQTIDPLPDPADPLTLDGLTPEDGVWFRKLSSWAARIAAKCPTQQSEAA